MRIIAGEWRGRLIRFDAREEIRPTPDRVRETVFNWLGQDLTGARCLDLFAGTGALGFEALSRNATHVTFIERSRRVCQQLDATARTLRAERFEIHCCDAIEFLARTAKSQARIFDVAFVDPPFASDMSVPALNAMQSLMTAVGRVYLESASPIVVPKGWRLSHQSRAGIVHFGLAAREES